MLDVCVVLSGHLSSCPRGVKFADALHDAGYQVEVVYPAPTDWVRRLDQALVARRPWRTHELREADQWQSLVARVLERGARWAWRMGLRTRIVARLGEWRFRRVVERGIAPLRPRMWLASNLPALVAVTARIRAAGGILAFDAEDDHVGMLSVSSGESAERTRRLSVLRDAVPVATLRFTASPSLAGLLSARYGVDFLSILNVPARSQVSTCPLADVDADRAVLYWCSQTIGPGRGLEPFLQVLAALRTPALLRLRGKVSEEFRARLFVLARAAGLGSDRIEFVDPLPPDDLVAGAKGSAAGLALETGDSENRRACLTNKIFEYLAAGVPVIMSRTPAQSALAATLGAAALLIDLDRPQAGAKSIDAWLSEREGRRIAACEALRFARDGLNWEQEQRPFLDLVRSTLGAVGSGHASS